MNLNYVGSLAERFMKFRSTLAETTGVSENIFNAMSIYVPKSLAENNLSEASYSADAVTADKFAVIAVTVDNYREVFAEGSNLLTQWLPVFNDGTNSAITLYIIVFDDTSFSPTLSAGALTWSPLTKAFNELYFISYFKTMFSEHYNGKTVSEGSDTYDDSNYFDMVLALSYLCETEATLSYCLAEYNVEVPEGEDTNICKVMSTERGVETNHCKTLVGSTKADRGQYLWGYINLIGGKRTTLNIHNGSYMIPIILGRWFEATNSSGQFIGNKLAKIRLTGNKVKPTGNPSPLNSDVNLNLVPALYRNLDDKNVGYFISISDNSQSNAELVRDRSIAGVPATASMISAFIDYQTSQDLANFASDVGTLTRPVLANEDTYQRMQSFLINNISIFSGNGRIVDLVVNFPPYSQAKKGNSFEGTAVWSARFVDDLEGFDISGTISF